MRALLLPAIMFLLICNTFAQTGLPNHKKGYFSTSGNCAFCHNNDFEANSLGGKDISQSTQWRSTMMGNANRDPFWRAKVSTELASVKNKEIQKVAADLCLKCHAPMGYTQSVFDGTDKDYAIKKIYSDTLAMDGVSCTLCHQIQPDNLGKPESFAGNYKIGKERKIFGPYKDVLTMPMENHEDFTPAYGEHLNKSEFCATCHTVITPHVTDKEEVKGVFFEQTAYLEWKNSGYPGSEINCQSCHMPSVEDGIDIASRPPWEKTKRKPFWFHQFVGGNTSMLRIFAGNTTGLNLFSPAPFYNDKLSETESNLKENSLGLSADAKLTGPELVIKVNLSNQAGHKLPTGIPFRRMWIHLTVKDMTGKTVFESGAFDTDGKIKNEDSNFEKHYDEISEENQVQIYEAVMTDASGKRTFSLLKADKYVKDNRIPPTGFTTEHPSYDTCRIYGDAVTDNNFNRDSKGNAGSGSDLVTYKIMNAGGNGLSINIEVLYQSINPGIIDYFGKYDSEEVSSFLKMYKNSGVAPVIMKSLNITLK